MNFATRDYQRLSFVCRNKIQTGYLLVALNGIEMKELNPDRFRPEHGLGHNISSCRTISWLFLTFATRQGDIESAACAHASQ